MNGFGAEEMYQVQQQGPPMPPQATPRTVASLRINSPWRRGNDNSWNPSLDTNNNMHSLDQPSTIANPAFYSHFGTFQRPAQQANEVTLEGVPIKGAASTDFTKGTLPKNFAQPLTCFYWHTYGRCTKSSDECLYAHYETGVVASAPVTLKGGKGPIAGRNAMEHVHSLAEREKQLKDWEATLVAKEMELNGKTTSIKDRERAEAVSNVYEVITRAKSVIGDAYNILTDRREELEAALSGTYTDGSDNTSYALSAMDAAVNAFAGIDSDLTMLEKQTEEEFGEASGMSESVRIYLDANA